MNFTQRFVVSAVILLLLGVSAQAQKTPSKRNLGAPIYPNATFIESFIEGPVARYLFGSNDLTISVRRFYEARTGKKAERIESPDGTETYRFVLKGKREAVLPELEVRVNHFPGGFIIPDERGETRRYTTTILISKKMRTRRRR